MLLLVRKRSIDRNSLRSSVLPRSAKLGLTLIAVIAAVTLVAPAFAAPLAPADFGSKKTSDHLT